jgi:hypothetical protein
MYVARRARGGAVAAATFDDLAHAGLLARIRLRDTTGRTGATS